jgi:LmbE family N-acetylglucosaminyl deacetylase
MRVIYLSAHLDDAVLSCGGLIFEQVKQGIPVEVWTIMCGAPPDKDPLPYQKRIDEDKKAVEMLGAKPVHLDFLDAFGRKGADSQRLYDVVESPVHPEDQEFITDVSLAIGLGIEQGDTLMCPLAIGAHVDHVVLRRACEELDIPLEYYADFPYIE